MNLSATSNNIGPLDLLFSAAEQILQTTQGAVHVDAVSDFIDSVRWTEPFIVSLVGFQIVLFCVTYVTRRRSNVQFLVLAILTVITLSAERLNEVGKSHWKSFATQDYFDPSGVFMIVFVCGPFVLLANFIVVCLLLLRCFSFVFVYSFANIYNASCRRCTDMLLRCYIHKTYQIGMGLRLVKIYAIKKRRQLTSQARLEQSEGSSEVSRASSPQQPATSAAEADKKTQ